ncbi:MAG: DUF480 domain-containing protein [bacterium]|nr:DUF480 domain-containing protein [bacterium]
MVVELNAHEARTLGVLIEKAFTTPDQYPLTMNALTNGCNQKSNRNPVVDFTEPEVTVALQGLRMKHLVGSVFPAGSRVEKWKQSGAEHLKVNEHDLSVIAELLMRGPQSASELRTRASRMRNFTSAEELGQSVSRLMDKGYVQRIPAGQGSRTERFEQLLAPALHPDGEEVPLAASPRASAPPAATPSGPRVEELEERIARLERQVKSLAEQLGEPLAD